MNGKKGDVSIAYMLTAFISVALVVVVVIFLMNQNDTGIVQSWKNIFPSFGGGASVQGQEGSVRYDILTGDVRHHEGGSWKKVSEPIEFYSLNGAVNEDQIKQAFEDFYMSSSTRPGKEIYNDGKIRAVAIGVANNDFIQKKWVLFNDKVFSRGAAIINIDPSDGPLLGIYYLNMDGSYRYVPGNEQPKDEPAIDRTKALLDAASWRDSVLFKPLSLGGNTFCVKKEDNHYLLIDLASGGEKEC